MPQITPSQQDGLARAERHQLRQQVGSPAKLLANKHKQRSKQDNEDALEGFIAMTTRQGICG